MSEVKHLDVCTITSSISQRDKYESDSMESQDCKIVEEMLARLFRTEESVPKHSFYIFEQNFMYMDGEYFYKASDLNKGAAFGELALVNKDAKRMAAIICESEVVFATLDRANFNECRQKVTERQEMKLFNFLTDIPFFQSIQKHKI